MNIEILTCGDNYIYLLINGSTAGVVDPSSADPVKDVIDDAGITLEKVFITHNHGDHTGGCRELKSSYGCEIIGPGQELSVHDGNAVHLGDIEMTALSVPGHTTNDVAYYSEPAKAVFTGDTLFAGGCGRLFGGTADQMWASLKKLRTLPDDTLVYCGHEYTVDNMEFAAHIEPGSEPVVKRLTKERDKQKAGTPTVPSTMKIEKETNPFLRCDDEAFKKAVGLKGLSDVDVFAEIRSRKNRW